MQFGSLEIKLYSKWLDIHRLDFKIANTLLQCVLNPPQAVIIIPPLHVKQKHLLNPLNVNLVVFLGWEVVEEFHFGMIIGVVGRRNPRGAAGVGGTAGGALGPARNTPVGRNNTSKYGGFDRMGCIMGVVDFI